MDDCTHAHQNKDIQSEGLKLIMEGNGRPLVKMEERRRPQIPERIKTTVIWLMKKEIILIIHFLYVFLIQNVRRSHCHKRKKGESIQSRQINAKFEDKKTDSSSFSICQSALGRLQNQCLSIY